MSDVREKSYLDKRLFKSVSRLNPTVSLSVSNVVNYTAQDAGCKEVLKLSNNFSFCETIDLIPLFTRTCYWQYGAI